MIGLALYLAGRTTRNRLHTFRRQLRSPRYVVAVLLGLGYLALVLFHPDGGTAPGLSPRLMETIGAALLAGLVLKWWVLGADRQALAFSPAEIQFLFSAPLSRRDLIRYKLVRAQLPIIASALLWIVLLRRSPYPVPRVLAAISFYLFFSTLFLHRLGAALTRDAVLGHGRVGWRLARGPVVILGILSILVAYAAWRVWPTLPLVQSDGLPWLSRIALLLERPPLSWVAFPFRATLRPLAAQSFAVWLEALGPAVAVAALHYVWVLRADRAFEDSAIAASVERARQVSLRGRGPVAARGSGTGRLASRLPLSVNGHPVWGLVWKNSVRLLRTTSLTLPLLVVVGLVVGAAVGGISGADAGALELAAVLASTALFFLVLFGPLWLRNDLRSDLPYLAVLKGWPLSGRVVVASGIISGALTLTLVEAPLLAVTLVGLPAESSALTGLEGLWPAVAAFIILPCVNAASYLIHNGAAVLFPSWVRTEIRPGGIEATGQQFLTMGASLLLLLGLSLGPAILATGLATLTWTALGSLSLLPAATLAGAGLLLEVFLAVDWLGDRFERLDLSQPN